MTDLNIIPKLSRYIKKIGPSEININKEEIFYRAKYSEIINYFKYITANSEDLEIFKYFKPKGALLINSRLGTDILDYLMVIAKNYYLPVIELNTFEVLKDPKEFFNVFPSILEIIIEENEQEIIEEKQGQIKENRSNENRHLRMVIIELKTNIVRSLKNKNLIQSFISFIKERSRSVNFIKKGMILVWINHDEQDLIVSSEELFDVFDLLIKIPVLLKSDREDVLKEYSEKNPRISFDMNAVINKTKDWEVRDLNLLLRMAILKHFLNADLNETSNEITDLILDLIDSGEFLPSITASSIERREGNGNGIMKRPLDTKMSKTTQVENPDITHLDDVKKQIRNQGVSEFMLNQLYENAASKNYNELVILIDKLEKNEPLQDYDRKLLAQYPFILNDTSNKAQINLEKANKRVLLMKQAFGK